MMRQWAVSVLVAGVLLAAVGAGPVHTVWWPRLEASGAGQHSSAPAHVRLHLFPRRVHVVPGDRLQRSFRIRNTTGERSAVRLRVGFRDHSHWVSAGRGRDRLHVALRTHRHWFRVQHAGVRVKPRLVLAPGRAGRVRVRVSLSHRAGNAAQGRHLRLALRYRVVPVRLLRH
jgi:hypothetical protein